MPGTRKKRSAEITAVESLGPGLFRIDLTGEGIGAGVAAGRFAMLEPPDRPDCILSRPFSYFLAPSVDHAAFLLKVVGKGTAALTGARVGTPVSILGPLGNAFPTPRGETWVVAGGVGAAPFGELAGKDRIRILCGARTVSEAGFARALHDTGSAAGANAVELATDDGSEGFAGSVVDLLATRLGAARPHAIFGCGPLPMLRAVTSVAKRHAVPCWVCLEERMACGVGICRGCAHLDASGGWRCICDDGPVYAGETIFAVEEGSA